MRDIIDRIIAGESLGRGGMGIVFEATHRTPGKRVAVKVLPFSFILDERSQQRFLNEARAAGQLEHPHIIPVFAVAVDMGVHYYVMQQVADSLHHAHLVGVIHRDITPSNLILDQSGKIWIADFGLAQIQGEPAANRRLGYFNERAALGARRFGAVQGFRLCDIAGTATSNDVNRIDDRVPHHASYRQVSIVTYGRSEPSSCVSNARSVAVCSADQAASPAWTPSLRAKWN